MKSKKKQQYFGLVCEIILYLFPCWGGTCHLLIAFANSLDPDQDRQNVGRDLDSNCLTFLMGSCMNSLKKSADNNKSMKNYSACKEIKLIAMDENFQDYS